MAALDFTRVGLERDETRREDAFALCIEHELTAISEEPARRTFEGEAHLIFMHLEVHHDEFARAETLDNSSLVHAWRINDDFLIRLELLAIFFVENNLRLRNLHFVTFTSHVLEQNRDVEFAATRDVGDVARIKIYLQPNVDLEFALKPVAYLARRNELAFFAREGRIVDEKIERDGRLVDSDSREWCRVGRRCNRLADENIGQSRNHDNIARGDFLRLDFLQAFEGEHLCDFAASSLYLQRFAVCIKRGRLFHEYRVTHLKCAFVHARDGETTQEVVVAEVEGLEPCRNTLAR